MSMSIGATGKTLPLSCVSAVFVAKTVPFLAFIRAWRDAAGGRGAGTGALRPRP